MSEKRIVVPQGMLKAAEGFDSCDQTERVLEAALHWLSENPIVPTEEQAATMQLEVPANVHYGQWMCIEWQRRMFLAPEPKPQDNPVVAGAIRAVMGVTLTRQEADYIIDCINATTHDGMTR